MLFVKCGLPISNVWEPGLTTLTFIVISSNASMIVERDIITACTDELAGTLSEPLTHGEILKVCSRLKSGTSAVAIDYEHIHFGGPSLW